MLVCVSFYPLHTGPRVQRASGIPCSLSWEIQGDDSGRPCREIADPYSAHFAGRDWLIPG